MLGGAGRGGIVFLFVSLAIFFPLFPNIDQVWLVHFLGAISSSLIPRLGSPWCLRNTSPLKGKIPCFLEVKFCDSYPDLIAWVSLETVSPKWQPNMLLKACQVGVTFLSRYTLSELICIHLKCWSNYFVYLKCFFFFFEHCLFKKTSYMGSLFLSSAFLMTLI